MLAVIVALCAQATGDRCHGLLGEEIEAATIHGQQIEVLSAGDTDGRCRIGSAGGGAGGRGGGKGRRCSRW